MLSFDIVVVLNARDGHAMRRLQWYWAASSQTTTPSQGQIWGPDLPSPCTTSSGHDDADVRERLWQLYKAVSKAQSERDYPEKYYPLYET